MRKASSGTLIKATCETCGDVELGVGDVRVRLCATTNQSSYTFVCPACGGAVSKAADARVVDVLIAAGVELVVWDMPAELDEHHAGPPIDYDDLIDFHFLLEATEAAEILTGLTVGADRSQHPAGGQRRSRARR